jgi:hypothetical protein
VKDGAQLLVTASPVGCCALLLALDHYEPPHCQRGAVVSGRFAGRRNLCYGIRRCSSCFVAGCRCSRQLLPSCHGCRMYVSCVARPRPPAPVSVSANPPTRRYGQQACGALPSQRALQCALVLAVPVRRWDGMGMSQPAEDPQLVDPQEASTRDNGALLARPASRPAWITLAALLLLAAVVGCRRGSPVSVHREVTSRRTGLRPDPDTHRNWS